MFQSSLKSDLQRKISQVMVRYYDSYNNLCSYIAIFELCNRHNISNGVDCLICCRLLFVFYIADINKGNSIILWERLSVTYSDIGATLCIGAYILYKKLLQEIFCNIDAEHIRICQFLIPTFLTGPSFRQLLRKLSA